MILKYRLLSAQQDRCYKINTHWFNPHVRLRLRIDGLYFIYLCNQWPINLMNTELLAFAWRPCLLRKTSVSQTRCIKDGRSLHYKLVRVPC